MRSGNGRRCSARFVVNDSEEVKNCLRRELEIFKAVKPYALTGMTEVERNRSFRNSLRRFAR